MTAHTAPEKDTPLEIAGKPFRSRLVIGTGKYRTYRENADAAAAAGSTYMHPDRAGNIFYLMRINIL